MMAGLKDQDHKLIQYGFHENGCLFIQIIDNKFNGVIADLTIDALTHPKLMFYSCLSQVIFENEKISGKFAWN